MQGHGVTEQAMHAQLADGTRDASRLETVVCDLFGEKRSEVVVRQRDLLHHVSPDEFSVVRCLNCGLLYLNPRPTPADIGRYYPEQYYAGVKPKTRTGIERLAKQFSGTIKRWIREDFYGYPASVPSGWLRMLRKVCFWPEYVRRAVRGRDIIPWMGEGRLLDLGCGEGANLSTLQEDGWDVHGIEMSKTAVAAARERVGNRIHHGTLETAPYADESFDVILLSHSLEHMFSPVATLERLRRLLQPSGLLVIAVPNVGSLEAKLFRKWWLPWDPPRHLYHFDSGTLRKTLERVGFKISRARTAVGTMFFMVSLDRAWNHWRGSASVPARRIIEKLIVKPICFIAGHLGYGTEIRVYAVKKGVVKKW